MQKDKFKRLGLVIGILIVLFSFWGKDTYAVGVRPMVLDLDLLPGETKEFELILTPSGKEELVDLSLYQPKQLLSGGLAYEKPALEAFSALGWVKLETNQVKVYPGEDVRVNCTVNVPFSAGGSYTVIIMVEPRAPTAQTGIVFQVRYAVRLNIRVERPGLRQVAELVDLSLQPGEENEPILRALIDNPSAWDYLVAGEVAIRDQERRLVERVTLQSPDNMGTDSETTRLYPKSQVEFLGEITKRLAPGEYSFRTYFRYGDQGQIVKNQNFTIAEGDFNFPSADEIGAFSVAPESITHGARAGERKTQVLEFSSEIGEPARIVVEAQPISPEYPFSLIDWIQLRMASNEFELPGRRNSRLGLTFAVPRDAEDASYHGNILIKAYATTDNELLSEKVIPVSILVGDQHQKKVEIRSLHGQALEDNKALLVLDIANTGNVPLQPQAAVIITDQEGEFVARGILTLPEGASEVIPLQNQRLEGEISDINPGVYNVSVSIEHDGQEILRVEKDLEITGSI